MEKIHVGFRAEQTTVDEVDALIPRYSGLGVEASRSDVLRALVIKGIDWHRQADKKSAREREAVAKKAGAI